MILKKKFFLSLTALSLVAFSSFAQDPSPAVDDIYEEDYGIYLKVGYNAMYATNISRFELSCNSTDNKILCSNDDIKKPNQSGKFDYNFMGASISLGKFIDGQISTDLEANMQYKIKLAADNKNNTFSGKETLYSGLFLNGNYAFNTDDLNPYVSLGIGGALTTDNPLWKKMNYYFGAQAKVGLSYTVSRMFTPYVNYKFVYLFPMSDNIASKLAETKTISTNTKTSFMLHNVEAGLMLHSF